MRTGKIARLPVEIRTQLNHRLQGGSSASRLLPWLNDLPAVRAALKEYFHSRPINPQNLSEWTQGGYQDWLQDQSPHDLSHCLTEDTTAFTSTHPPVTDALSHWSATRLALRTRRINALQEKDPEAADKLLTKMIRDLTTLQQSQTRVRREQRQRDHLTFRETQAREKTEQAREQTEADHEAWLLHPDNRSYINKLWKEAYPNDFVSDDEEDEDETADTHAGQDGGPQASQNHPSKSPDNCQDDTHPNENPGTGSIAPMSPMRPMSPNPEPERIFDHTSGTYIEPTDDDVTDADQVSACAMCHLPSPHHQVTRTRASPPPPTHPAKP